MHERDAGFAAGGTLRFPSMGPELSAIQLLEGNYLAKALSASGRAKEERLNAAAAARAQLCESVGKGACRDINDVEQIEGSAEYVAMSLLFGGSPTAKQQHVRDSLRVHLTRVNDARQLGRNYSFWVGAAWMSLSAADGVRGWQDVVERRGVDELTRMVINRSSTKPAPDVGSTSSLGLLDSLRQVTGQLLSRERANSDSAEHAFSAADGTLIQIEWTPRERTRSHTHTGKAGLETEYSVRFGDGLDSLVVDGMFQHTCCPSRVRAKAAASEVHLEVAGHIVSVGNSMRQFTGPITLRTRHLNLAYHFAEVALRGDSIFIQLNPVVGRDK